MVSKNTELPPDKQILTKQERIFARLVLEGASYSSAYREAFNKQKAKPNTITGLASRLAAQPRIKQYMRSLSKALHKQDILNHTQFLSDVRRNWREAVDQGNLTAAASFARIAGQCIGSLSDQIIVERAEPADLIRRIAGDNPDLAVQLERMLNGRRDFDA